MQDTEWEPPQDGKGSWRLIGDYRLVVKHEQGTQEDPDWWWGIYEDADDLMRDGHAPTEEEAREEADDLALML